MNNDESMATSPLFLVIDDDPSAIRLVSEVLKKDGRVIFATNGPDGLTQAAHHTSVLSDRLLTTRIVA